MGQKKQINARIPDNLHDVISERARLIEETHGGYLGLIAQWWYAQGHPPVTDYEARILSQKQQAAKRPGVSQPSAPRDGRRDGAQAE